MPQINIQDYQIKMYDNALWCFLEQEAYCT